MERDLLLSLWRRRGLGVRGLLIQRIDDLAGTCIVKAFPRLVLNGARISFQMIHMILQTGIFFLQLINFLLQSLVFTAFLLVNSYAIVPQNDVIAEQHSDDDRQNAGDTTARRKQDHQKFDATFDRRLRIGTAVGQIA